MNPASSIGFDPSGARASTGPSDGSILQSIRDAAMHAGVDPIAELYNEALELAQDGHYGEAQSRLNVLLGLAPADGEAHLLLAKVLVAGQQWRRAVAALDAAASCGTSVPDELRSAILRNLNADEESVEEQRKARVAREQAEITRLRTESRRLRSENAALVARHAELERETARWAWIATGTSAVCIVFMIGATLFGGGGSSAPTDASATPAAAAAVATTGAGAAPVDPASPRNGTLAEQAGAALMSGGVMEGAQLEVIVRGTTAQLSGYAPTHAQLKKAVKLIDDIEGIDKVGTEGVILLSKRDGTTHVVKPGEVLGKIASDYYGKASLHTKILDANPELAGGANLKVGMTIKIPPVKDEPAPAAAATP